MSDHLIRKFNTMEKTKFQSASPPSVEECLKWFTEVQGPNEPMPPDVLWRMFVVMRHLASRLLAHERALATVIEEADGSANPN
jgi:hypothetical protein